MVLSICGMILGACAITPDKISDSELQDFLAEDEKNITLGQEEISKPITLEQAVARAIKYNIEKRITAMEDALAQNDLTAAKLGLIPGIAASSGYAWRNVPDSSHSRTEETGSEGTTNSYSTETKVRESDLSLSWNVLDFGVSYFQARQAGNRQLVASERKRRVLHNLIMQVRTAYWKAASAKLMAKKIQKALEDTKNALKRLQAVIDRRLGDPIEALRTQKTLVETIAQLDRINVGLVKAKPEIAALMGLRPGTQFDLAVDPKATYKAPKLPLRITDMEKAALSFRPELREAEYEVRISLDETKKAFARMFPGVEISLSRNHTTNGFSNHPVWYDVGARVTINLLNILSAPSRLEKADIGENITRAKRMAMNLAVLTQVHIAYRDFNSNIRQYDYAKRLWVLDQLIARKTTQSQANDTESLLSRLRANVSEVQTELRFFEAYASAQNGLARMYSSLGLDPLPEHMTDVSVSGITNTLTDTFRAWRIGKFPWNEMMVENQKSADKGKIERVSVNLANRSTGLSGFEKVSNDGLISEPDSEQKEVIEDEPSFLSSLFSW